MITPAEEFARLDLIASRVLTIMADTQSASVSVIIPNYKHAHYLGEAIESVLAQSPPPAEVIVVDDGSPDNTAEVAARYPGVRYVRQENRGVAAARNHGLRLSRGDYIVFLDSDDRLLPHALATNLEQLAARPEHAFVCGHRRHIALDGAPLPTNLRACVDTDHYTELLRRNYIGPPGAVMYRRSGLDAVKGFDESLRSAEDYDLSLRIARQFPIYCHHRVVVEYRVDRNSPVFYHRTDSVDDLIEVGLSGRYEGLSDNHEVMLQSIISVLRRHRRYIRGNLSYESAYRAGIRDAQQIYGELVAHKVRMLVRARKYPREIVRSLTFLLRYYPQGLTMHAQRKIYRLLSRSR